MEGCFVKENIGEESLFEDSYVDISIPSDISEYFSEQKSSILDKTPSKIDRTPNISQDSEVRYEGKTERSLKSPVISSIKMKSSVHKSEGKRMFI